MKTTEQVTKIFQKHFTEWQQSQQNQTSGYEYESSFVTMMQEVE